MPAPIAPDKAVAYMLEKKILPLEPYTYARDPWRCSCQKCGKEFTTTYDRAKQGRGCPFCANKLRGAKTSERKRLPLSEVVDRLAKQSQVLVGEYQGGDKDSQVKCTLCDSVFSRKIRFNKGKAIPCPKCQPHGRIAKVKTQIHFQELIKREQVSVIHGIPDSLKSEVEITCPEGHTQSLTVRQAVRRDYLCSMCREIELFEQTPNTSTSYAPKPRRTTRSTEAWGNPDFLRNQLLKLNWELIEHNGGLSQNATVKCTECGSITTSQLNRLLDKYKVCSCVNGKQNRLRAHARNEKNAAALAEIARARGGQVVTFDPENNSERVKLKCSQGHAWESSTYSVVRMQTWCPYCAGNKTLSIDEVREEAIRRGGLLLTSEYTGVDGTYKFQCNLGHKFNNRFSKIKKGQWCPTCSKSGKSEEIARTTFEQLFETSFPKKRPKWLRNSRGNQMEFDGLSEKLHIAFEYQGRQHFEEIGIFNTNLEQRIADDLRKAELAEEHGISLVILSDSDSYDDFPGVIKTQLEASNRLPEGIDFDKPINIGKAYIRNDRTKEFKELLSAKNIELISPKWITSDYLYELKCLTCGHEWKARGNAFFNARRVSGCKKCAIKALSEKNLHSVQVLEEFAARFEGTVLSKDYVGRKQKYEFKCKQGHIFTADFNNMAHRNQFCAVCEGREIRRSFTAESAALRFNELGFTQLEPMKQIRGKIQIRCNTCGNELHASLEALETGSTKCKTCNKDH